MASQVNAARMTELLAGISDVEVRELCIESLRVWRKSRPGQSQTALHDTFGTELVRQLYERKPELRPTPDTDPKQSLIDSLAQPGFEAVAEFICWFVQAGFAWPLVGETNQYPITLHITRSGLRFLEGSSDHPLLPGFVNRIATRCPRLPDAVQALLLDARACLDHGLMRPAIQLMGVTYEVAIEHVVDSLVARQALAATVADEKAARRIAAIRGVINTVLPNSTLQQKEDRFAVHAAYDFADQIRRRRNDASHTTPRYDFEDRHEAEEFLISAGRHLPYLWQMF